MCSVFSSLRWTPGVDLLGHRVTPGLPIWERAGLCSTGPAQLPLAQAGLQRLRAGRKGRPHSLCEPSVFQGDCYKVVWRRWRHREVSGDGRLTGLKAATVSVRGLERARLLLLYFSSQALLPDELVSAPGIHGLEEDDPSNGERSGRFPKRWMGAGLEA